MHDYIVTHTMASNAFYILSMLCLLKLIFLLTALKILLCIKVYNVQVIAVHITLIREEWRAA